MGHHAPEYIIYTQATNNGNDFVMIFNDIQGVTSGTENNIIQRF